MLPFCDSEGMQIHLDEIAKYVEEGKHAVIVVDQARWHVSKIIKCPKNITLVSLPPYSPELNPMEQVWQFLKQKFLANRVFKTYEDIVDACCQAWHNFKSELGRIKQTCSRSWALVN